MQRGECELWWSKQRTMLLTMEVDSRYWPAIVSKALRGEASESFWHELERGNSDVDDIMRRLTQIFDANQLEDVLKELMDLTQEEGESILKFKARFDRIIKVLDKHEAKFGELALATLFGIKIKESIWREARKQKPNSLREIMEFIATNGLVEIPDAATTEHVLRTSETYRSRAPSRQKRRRNADQGHIRPVCRFFQQGR